MRSVTVTEKHAWIAVGIFAAIVVLYFWFKGQLTNASNAGYAQGSADQYSLDNATFG